MEFTLTILNLLVSSITLALVIRDNSNLPPSVAEVVDEAVLKSSEALEKAWNEGIANILGYDETRAKKAVNDGE